MQDIKTFVRQLRHAANVLEELFVGNGTAAIAKKIIEGPSRPPKLDRRSHRKGLHWTQRPENKRKVLAMAKRGAATRNKQASTARLKMVANG